MADDFLRNLVGSWELVEAHVITFDGVRTEPWGPAPTGMFMLTAQGEYSAHVMRSQRDRFALEQPTPEEKQQAYDDYVSYYGKVVGVDDTARSFTTRVLGATNANWIGGDQVRYVEIRDQDHLVLRSPTLAHAGMSLTASVVWARRK